MALQEFCQVAFRKDERIIREVRRRTKVVGAFADGQSALMLIAARLRPIAATKWGTRRYLTTELLQAGSFIRCLTPDRKRCRSQSATKSGHYLRKKLYRSLGQLQADHDGWLTTYNEQRTHQGKMCCGRTPRDTFDDGLRLAKEKLIDDAA